MKAAAYPISHCHLVLTRDKHTIRNDGMGPANPLATKAKDDAALLVLEFGHGGERRKAGTKV